jgi:hypothetical protein
MIGLKVCGSIPGADQNSNVFYIPSGQEQLISHRRHSQRVSNRETLTRTAQGAIELERLNILTRFGHDFPKGCHNCCFIIGTLQWTFPLSKVHLIRTTFRKLYLRPSSGDSLSGY